MTNRGIATQLFVSVKAVEFHLGHVFRKLGLVNRTELAVLMATRERSVSMVPDSRFGRNVIPQAARCGSNGCQMAANGGN
jgi:hypothetical protein